MALCHLWGGNKHLVCLERNQGQVATLKVIPQACNCFIYDLLRNQDHIISSGYKTSPLDARIRASLIPSKTVIVK